MKEQVLSIQQMQHLKELGVDTSKASMYWSLPSASGYKTKLNIVGINGNLEASEKYGHSIGAFTLQNMLGMMPILYYQYGRLNLQPSIIGMISDDVVYPSLCYIGKRWEFAYRYTDGIIYGVNFTNSDVMKVCYDGLCWLAENKLLEREGK